MLPYVTSAVKVSTVFMGVCVYMYNVPYYRGKLCRGFLFGELSNKLDACMPNGDKHLDHQV